MANEMPKSEDLAREQLEVKQRVQKIQDDKNEDIARRIKEMDTRRNNIKESTGLLEAAEDNVKYYTELKESGQLPKEDMDKLTRAEELVSEIKAKMAENNEAIKNTMAVPDVQGKVMEQAGEINGRVNEEKAEKEKAKMMEEKYYQWYEKLADMAEELDKKQKEETANYNNTESKLVEKIQGSISDKGVREKLQEKLKYFLTEKQMGQFKEEISQCRENLGWVKFFEKGRVDSLVNSIELKDMEAAVERLNKFIKDEKLEGRRFGNFKECTWAILHNNTSQIANELKDLFRLQWEKPSVYSDSPIDNAYKKASRLKEIKLSSRELRNFDR